MVDLLVSGVTDPTFLNGTYMTDGTSGGKERWSMETDGEEYYIVWFSNQWRISNFPDGDDVTYFSRTDVDVLGEYNAEEGTGSVIVSEAPDTTIENLSGRMKTKEIKTSYPIIEVDAPQPKYKSNVLDTQNFGL